MTQGSLLLAAAFMIFHQQPADAQQDAVQSFTSAYFVESNPADAYDMIQRLPGFELVEGDEEVRGFTGSRGNVLFDGRPPPGKQETLEQMLRRIPASSVLKIELIRGGAASAVISEYDLIANIVRRSGALMSASALAGISAARGVGLKPDMRVEVFRQTSEHRLDGAVVLETEIDDDSGRGSISERDANGGLTGIENRNEREVQRSLSGDIEYKLPIGQGEVIANLSGSGERTSERIGTGHGEVVVATEREQLLSYEGSAQLRMPFGSGEIEGVAAHRFGHLRVEAAEENERFSEARRTSETIGRIEVRRETEHLQLFGSVEAAINRLRSDAALAVDGVQVPLSGTDVNVSEQRSEAAAGVVWKPRPSLSVEPSIRAEYSNIRSAGDSPHHQSFLFLKPRLRIGWDGESNSLQATVERQAAQLDFGDFVATAALDRDEVTVGARELRPPRNWSATASYERHFWGDGALVLTVKQEWIDDVVEHVVVESAGLLFDAIGNIGSGIRRTFKAELTTPLTQFGIPGLQLRAVASLLRSRVSDPVTGRGRIIAEDSPFEGEMRLMHDVPGGRWSWGAQLIFGQRERDFRFDELRLERRSASLGAHLEYRPRSDVRIRFDAANINSSRLIELREKFFGLRSQSAPESTELRRIATSPIFALSVRKSLGSTSTN